MSKLNIDKPELSNTDANAYAAIDLGTNNCRLLIAQLTPNGFDVVDGLSKTVRLGEGVAATNQLNPNAMGRTLNAIRSCAQKINNWNIKRIRCVATEACRRAKNGEEFLSRVVHETGLSFEIVTPNLEAHLTLHGCIPLFVREKPKILLFDIGGGSTEIVWAEMTNPFTPHILGVLSFPMGVVTLAETYGVDLLESEKFNQICGGVAKILAPFDSQYQISEAIEAGHVQMVGTSGTVTTLGALTLGLERYERKRVDGLQMSFKTIHQQISEIVSMDMDARRGIPCIGLERAGLMVMGCALLKAICTKWPVGELRVADRGIREGLLVEMIEKDRQNTAPSENPSSAIPITPTYIRR